MIRSVIPIIMAEARKMNGFTIGIRMEACKELVQFSEVNLIEDN